MAEVVSIRSDVAQSENKQAFLDMVAQEYDKFVGYDNEEPVLLAIVFVDKDGSAKSQWLARKEAVGKVSLFLIRALHKLTSSIYEMER